MAKALRRSADFQASGDVLLAHATCGTHAAATLDMRTCGQAAATLRPGVSVPGGLPGAPAPGAGGPPRGGVLGDITNVGYSSLLGSKPVAKPAKVDPVAVSSGALEGTAVVVDSQRQAAAATSADVVMLTPRCLEDADADADAEDPQQVAEYARDIYGMMSREEASFLPDPAYLESQQDINAKMRAILIDWLVEVHMKYKLKTETLFLSVNVIDRFLEKRSIARKKLQLVGVTGMLIAAKFEEIYPPEVRDFVYITDKAYTKEEILSMEVMMLTVLEFGINCPTTAHFFERYQRINGCSDTHRHLLQYVLELTLPDFKMLRYSPSHLAAAATLLSNKLLKQQPAWPQAMVRHTQQTELMVKGCAKEMCGLLDAADKSPLQAVRKKFSQPRFHNVGKMSF